MARPLRVLIVEDVEDHALLLVRELHKAGLEPVYERIETVQGLAAALETGGWEVIISDFSLPGFTAVDTLRMVHDLGLDIPVIIVSGVIGEESAVDAMRAGAKDFILKGKYSRLAPAIERELHEAALRRERRSADEELVRAHEELKAQRAELERQHQELLQVVEELRQKDQMMIQQSRMAAIGEVLNNIAHHWRQPLNVLGLNIQELGLLYEAGGLTREVLDSHIDQAMEILLKLSAVIDDFIDFSAVDREKSRFRVEQVVSRTVSLVREGFSQRNIELTVEISGDPEVSGYANQYRQVLLNILMNAKDAFESRRRDHPRIALRCWEEEGRAVVTVTDNAGGIGPESIDKIFDPFYTTKQVGKGTGVGLYIARNIIEKDMGGRLTARNVDDGAEFRIEV